MKCDFCSSSEIKWDYPAESFSIPEKGWGSEGGWAACEICHDLIEADDWEGLAQRSLNTSPLMVMTSDLHLDLEISAAMLESFRGLHQEFRKHRTGKAISV